MPARMILTVLVSLFAVNVFGPAGTNITSSTAPLRKELTTGATQSTSLNMRETNDFISSTVIIPTNTSQHETTEHRIASEKTSLSPVSSNPPQTPDKTEDTHPSRPPETTTTNRTSNEMVSHEPTLPTASGPPNVTATTAVNTTGPGHSHSLGKGDLAANPGLVAVLCIFCIVLALVLLVAVVKCVGSPRSNFERLEDVQMGKVNEQSPFAQYSK